MTPYRESVWPGGASRVERRLRLFHRLRLGLIVLPAALVLASIARQRLPDPRAAVRRTIERTVVRAKSAQRFVRAEDLPLAHPSTEDLPLVPPVAARPLLPDEVTPALVRKADEVLWTKNPPMGAEIPIEVEGATYIARIERHFHEVGGPLRPWGYHKGVTLYAVR